MTIGEAGAPVQRCISASTPRSTSCRWTAGGGRCTSTRPGCRGCIPSPNIPTLDSAIVYPGAVLFEGTLLSEGRGTTRPFELIGAPWIDGDRFAEAMNRARPARRVLPAGLLRADVPQARAADLRRLPDARAPTARRIGPVRIAVEMIEEFRARSPREFAWREPPYEYEHGEAADRHPLRIRSAAHGASTPARPSAPIARRSGRRTKTAFRRAAAKVPACTDAVRSRWSSSSELGRSVL